MLEIGYTAYQQKHYVTCHSSLLCYWSATIRDAVYAQANPVRCIWIEFEHKDEQITALWKQVVQWCYTGRLFDPTSGSDASIGTADDIELIWNVAVSLEMNELANYCMHLIIVKYSWGITSRDTLNKKIHPRDSPYDAWGPYHVFINCYKLGVRHRKLLEFMEEFIGACGPLAPRKRARASPATQQSWQTTCGDNEDFRDWIEQLGGLEHERVEAVLPTHSNQWDTYMIPAHPRVPDNIHQWSEAHDANTQWDSNPVDLMGAYGNAGDAQGPDFQWTFYTVAAGWIF
ncbi:uncharacterized protein GGS22DRAFT_194035 [Annulohypoxylon maeteangense]|uniref:uncharacterized protein n=1 Tax=Annulohypoxylon maeteangense TaxID=1927788 RepID=UPI00200833B7|nr:uncharacterized protein GGS22DRAFT_194035 [Annulohypoxylon maeteangense]KAI0889625.1 hypothetical protein GGS22DRAFT_194035 [Annulohypoxylon maeteangense]